MRKNLPNLKAIAALLYILIFYVPLHGYAQQLALGNEVSPGKKADQQPQKSKSLQMLLFELEEKFKVSFNYDNDLVKDLEVSKKLDASSTEKLDHFLRELLTPFKLTFNKVNDSHYLIVRDTDKTPVRKIKNTFNYEEEETHTGNANVKRDYIPSVQPILRMLDVQDKTVTGKVTDENNEALPGVNILVKGSTTGTVTDIDGNYRIAVPDDNAGRQSVTLLFSSVGYVTEEVVVGNRSVINISMTPDIQALSEIVVVGYGSVEKSDLTGSVSSISNEDFEKQPVIRVEDALKGRAAGVQVQKPNGAPGAGMKIRIRGSNSINGSNDPLYVIDGFVGGDISTLNPNEIASIDILKDASATAIYGSRGANGVIIITTKSAKAGDAKISFDAFYSIDQVSKKYDLLGGVEYMETVNARHDALGLAQLFTNEDIDEIRRNGDTNWQDEILRTGGIQNYQLSFSGGGEKAQYYLSGTYANQKGIIENSWYKRYSLRANIDSELSEKFDVSFNLYSTVEDTRNNYTYNGRGNALGAALIYPPNLPVYDASTGGYTESPSYGPIASNPVYSALERNFDSNALTLLSNIQLNYEILKGLNLSISGGVNGRYFDSPYLKRYSPGSEIATTEAGHDNGYNWSLQNTNILSYRKTFAEIHTIDVSAIYEQQISRSRTNGAWATGFPTISLGYDNLGLGETRRVYSGYNDWSLQSYLGRVNYTLLDRYLFTFTFRSDGSSKFQGDNKYGYFPSGAVAWRLSDEPFLEGSGIFQDLKIRASYGLTGSQAIGAYKTLNVLTTGQNYPYDGTNPAIGIGPGSPANPNLKWETTAQADIGIDFGILGGRLTGTLDYYHKKTTDLLLNVLIPDYAGGGSVTQNIGSLENKGFEVLLSGVLVDKNNFSINSSINFSLNRNKVLDLGEEEEIFTDGGYSQAPYTAPPFIIKKGEPLGQFRGLIFDGLWGLNEETEASEFGNVPGDSKYADLDDNQSIDGDDMASIGNAQPDFIWGWNTTITFHSFDLNFLINGMQGNDVWNYTRWLTIGMGADVKNPTSTDIRNRWTPQNQNTDVPGFSNTDVTYVQSSKFIEDGSFIRFSNITLGYNLPEALASKLKLSQARAYISAQNMFTITDYSGFDPELSSTPNWSDVAQGIDNGTYPATKTFTVGLKFSF